MARPAPEAGALDWFTRPSATSTGSLNLAFNALDRHVVRGLADEPALLHPFAAAGTRSSYSYADLLEQVGQLGGALRELGVTPGRTVVLALPVGPELVFGLLACARIGAVVVPLIDDAPDGIGRLGHDPAVDRPAVVVVDSPRRAVVGAVLGAAGRAPDYEVVRQPEAGTVDASAGTFDLAVLMRPGSFQPAACAELAPGSPFLLRLSPSDAAGTTTVHDQAWGHELAAAAVLAGWAPGSYVHPADDPTAAAPYGALLGPLLVGATVELRE
ncbi:MAG: AMP-binding protein [Janthinobacterium lividum]